MKESLKKFGLTEGEAKVYLALLKLGTSTVGSIVKESRVSYSKVYDILERLLKKGLISYIVNRKIKNYNAVPPARLREFLENKEKEISNNINSLNTIIPQLNKISNKNKPNSSEIFIGVKGLKTAYELLTRDYNKEKILKFFYVHEDRYSEDAHIFYAKEFAFFKENKIKLYGIANPELKRSKDFKKLPSFVKLRFVKFPLPSTIDIYNDKILIIAWRDDPFACLITSKEIAGNFEKYFDAVWCSSSE